MTFRSPNFSLYPIMIASDEKVRTREIQLTRTWHCPFTLLHHSLHYFDEARMGIGDILDLDCTDLSDIKWSKVEKKTHCQLLEWTSLLDVCEGSLQLFQFDIYFLLRLPCFCDLNIRSSE